jgi:UDP-2,4-diacetamido-2,4,6-trideoxy-beta-L-altropyranose hydrolase
MRVAFRVDSSARIGSGHLVRCLTLAGELRRRGAEILFLSKAHHGDLIERAERERYVVKRLPSTEQSSFGNDHDYSSWSGVDEVADAAETIRELENWCADWLVVDHYGLGRAWESTVRSGAARLLAIDDIARPHDTNALLDQNWFGRNTAARYDGIVAPGSRMLLGPRYALLRSEYAQTRATSSPRDGSVRRVLVYFGGTDYLNDTGAVLQALSSPELLPLIVDVVIGPNHPDPAGIARMVEARPRTTLYQSLSSLAELMERADLAVGAGGATTWERACLGLPSITVVLALNQRDLSLAVAEEGAQVVLDLDQERGWRRWRNEIVHLASDPDRVKRMSIRASALTDGRGVLRVVRSIYGVQDLSLLVRTARPEDELVTFEWANDSETREASFSPGPISATTHTEWFRQKLSDPQTLFLIGEDEAGLPVGQVRFDPGSRNAEVVVSISVDACARGGGVGSCLLQQAMRVLHARTSTLSVIAEVREGNARSATLFLRSGFEEIEARRPRSRCFIHRASASAG